MPTVCTMTEKGKIQERLSHAPKGVWKGCRSLLIPLMIAVFTITTTILQMNATTLINEQSLRIATDNRDIANYTRLQQLAIEEQRREADKQAAKNNREQDLYIANETRLYQIAIEGARLEHEWRIEDERRAADFLAAESRQMDSILAAYLKEMSEILLNDNFTLENRRWAIVVRAKTLTVLRQLDGKRKSHAVQFLYEAKLLTYRKHPVDLTNADLDNIDMSGRKLDSLSLGGASLHNASFIGTTLDNSDFNNAKLFNSTFEKAKLTNTNFFYCDASGSKFDGANLTGTIFTFARLEKTSWRSIRSQNVIFDKAKIDDADFHGAELQRARFNRTSLRGTSFREAYLQYVDWRSAKTLGADFFKADLRQGNINLKQLRRTFSYDNARILNGTGAKKMNLLGNGDAERSSENGSCTMHGWISGINMVVRPYATKKVATSLGACYFTGLEGAHRATMRQRVKIDPKKNEGKSSLWIYGRCRELIPDDEFQIQIQIVQFSKENNTLANETLTLYSQDEQAHSEKHVLCNSFTTQVEFEVIFRRQQEAPTNRSFGYCDNLRLSIYNESYS